MRRVVSMLMLSVVLFVAAHVGAADRVEVRNGSLHIAQPAEKWEQTDVVVTQSAQKYPAEWRQAFRNPGTVVPVKTSIKSGAMRDLVHQQVDTVLELGVVMTGDVGGRVIDVVGGEERVVESVMFYNLYIFFWGAAMLLMTLACWLMRYEKTPAFVAFVAFVALAAAAAAAAVAAAAVAAVAVAVAFVALVAAANEDLKKPRTMAVIFYMAMVISIIAFYS